MLGVVELGLNDYFFRIMSVLLHVSVIFPIGVRFVVFRLNKNLSSFSITGHFFLSYLSDLLKKLYPRD